MGWSAKRAWSRGFDNKNFLYFKYLTMLSCLLGYPMLSKSTVFCLGFIVLSSMEDAKLLVRFLKLFLFKALIYFKVETWLVTSQTRNVILLDEVYSIIKKFETNLPRDIFYTHFSTMLTRKLIRDRNSNPDKRDKHSIRTSG